MSSSTRELWLAFIAILAITMLYLFVVVTQGGAPAASEFFGHSLGVLGFALMLMTETLYSLRKRSRSARWGRMSDWLQFHIFTGLVGPYLVLLHTSWKFNGLAGVVMLMTAIVVASGFIGRYIYTAIPRSADGIELEAGELQRLVEETELELQRLLETRPRIEPELAARALPEAAGKAALAAPWVIVGRWAGRWRGWLAKRALQPANRIQIDRLERLSSRRSRLRRQVASLARARKMLSLWHSLHVPIGLALFTAAFIHIGAAIYYATLLR